jgi:hypothetical protein
MHVLHALTQQNPGRLWALNAAAFAVVSDVDLAPGTIVNSAGPWKDHVVASVQQYGQHRGMNCTLCNCTALLLLLLLLTVQVTRVPAMHCRFEQKHWNKMAFCRHRLSGCNRFHHMMASIGDSPLAVRNHSMYCCCCCCCR